MTPEELQYLCDERAAILELDGGLTREESERKARLETYGPEQQELPCT